MTSNNCYSQQNLNMSYGEALSAVELTSPAPEMLVKPVDEKISIKDKIKNKLQTKKEEKSKPKPKKNELMNVIFKFLLALIWVAISSVVVFIILISYKKLILGKKKALPNYENMGKSLYTPRNFKEALKLFLEKTNWH